MENQLKKEIERKYAERKKAANAKSEYYRQQLFNDESYVNALNLRNGIKFSLSKAKYAGNLEEIEKKRKKISGSASRPMQNRSKARHNEIHAYARLLL